MRVVKVGRSETERTRALLRAAGSLGTYTFNPSIRSLGTDTVVAVRTSDSARGPVSASLVVVNGETLSVTDNSVVDLSAVGASRGIAPVADPKLFSYRGAVWASFNTGFVRTGNAVYVMQVYPEVGEPLRCDVPGRQRIEKNWGFFEGESGDLRALYMLDPLTVVTFGKVAPTHGPTALRGEVILKTRAPKCKGLTIGTQPVRVDGQLLLIAHERIGPKNWRGYLGRAVSVRLSTGGATAEVSAPRFLHERRTVLGTRPRRNKHLWFATYFSGIDVRDGVVTLSYGINDQRAHVVELPLADL